jgi:hypothetical protein
MLLDAVAGAGPIVAAPAIGSIMMIAAAGSVAGVLLTARALLWRFAIR